MNSRPCVKQRSHSITYKWETNNSNCVYYVWVHFGSCTQQSQSCVLLLWHFGTKLCSTVLAGICSFLICIWCYDFSALHMVSYSSKWLTLSFSHLSLFPSIFYSLFPACGCRTVQFIVTPLIGAQMRYSTVGWDLGNFQLLIPAYRSVLLVFPFNS